MWRPSSSLVNHKTRSLLLFVLRRKSTRTQAQLHTLGVEVNLNLVAAVFPNRTSFFSIPANRARSSADHARLATWQLVVLVPRSTETHVAKPVAISRNAQKSAMSATNLRTPHSVSDCTEDLIFGPANNTNIPAFQICERLVLPSAGSKRFWSNADQGLDAVLRQECPISLKWPLEA